MRTLIVVSGLVLSLLGCGGSPASPEPGRTVPNFQGEWTGSSIIRSCTQTGIFATLNSCAQWSVGNVLATSMSITQSNDVISGTFLLGNLTFTPFTTSIQNDGTAVFSGRNTQAATITFDVTWKARVSPSGRIIGSHSQSWRSTTFAGEMHIESDIVDGLTRQGS